MTSPIDVSRAAVRHTGDGAVTFSDPGSPWTVRLWASLDGGRARIDVLQIQVNDPAVPVTAGRLATLPLPHLLHVAVTQVTPTSGYPNEAYYRMLAQPKPPGQACWDGGHWGRVLEVFAWGRAVGYRGGPRRAVADMWGVAVNPTVARWLRYARRVHRAG